MGWGIRWPRKNGLLPYSVIMLVGMATDTVHSLASVGLNLVAGLKVSTWLSSSSRSNRRF